MEDFEPQLHIEHYRKLLEVEFDPERREIVARLLQEAEAELRKSSEATGAPENSQETARREAREDQARLAGSPRLPPRLSSIVKDAPK